MAKTVTTPWDPADHLKTDEDMPLTLRQRWRKATPYWLRRRSVTLHAPKE